MISLGASSPSSVPAASKRLAVTGERVRLADLIFRNYGEHGIWTLTRESYQALLKQRYGALGDALRALADLLRPPIRPLRYVMPGVSQRISA